MKWINVKDELPDNYQDVLFTDGKSWYAGYFSSILKVFNQNPPEDAFYGTSFTLEEITHWTIPELPKE